MLLICQNVTLCAEHGLEFIMFYVQKHLTPLAALFWSSAGLRQAARGRPAFVGLAYSPPRIILVRTRAD